MPYTGAYLEFKTLYKISNLPNVASFFPSSVIFTVQLQSCPGSCDKDSQTMDGNMLSEKTKVVQTRILIIY